VAADLIRAVLAALAAGVAPGYFWAGVLRPASRLAERLTYSAVLSMASVPAIAVLLARATGAAIRAGCGWSAACSARRSPRCCICRRRGGCCS